MGFWLKTPNTENDVQTSKVFVGKDLEDAQVWIYAACGAFGGYFWLLANVSVFWKAVAVGLAAYAAKTFSSMTKGRTAWSRFRMFARKKSSGNSAVDRGADYSYFSRPNR